MILINNIIYSYQSKKVPFVCGAKSKVPFWADKFLMNETCDVNLNYLTFTGTTR